LPLSCSLHDAPASVHRLDGAVHVVLEELRTRQREMKRLFPGDGDILNAARTLDSKSAEPQMLARNGIEQAAPMNRASRGGHGAGISLLALAEILSGCRRRIAANACRTQRRDCPQACCSRPWQAETTMKGSVIAESGKLRCRVLGLDPARDPHVIDTNQYLIVANGQGMLLDPGGGWIFPRLLGELTRHLELDAIRILFASQQNPDIISSLPLWLGPNPDATTRSYGPVPLPISRPGRTRNWSRSRTTACTSTFPGRPCGCSRCRPTNASRPGIYRFQTRAR
jgi:hypothetical protein